MFATTRLSRSIVRVASSTTSFRNLQTGIGIYGRVGNKPAIAFLPQTRHESTSKQPQNWKKLTNEDWAERLTSEAYFCTREGGTEPPFSGQYVTHKAEGIYKCVCCASDLFTSKSKYDSGSGWPSFHTPAEEGGVIRRKDISHGMVRIEVLCANCNSHLGHVFEDGPEPTGQRYCVNSVCLKFTPKKIN